jgi:hypothetical protein
LLLVFPNSQQPSRKKQNERRFNQLNSKNVSLHPIHVFLQMGSFFVAQGVNMDRALALPWGGSFVIPAASLA